MSWLFPSKKEAAPTWRSSVAAMSTRLSTEKKALSTTNGVTAKPAWGLQSMMTSLFSRRSLESRRRWDLSEPLMQLSDKDPWSIADACQGMQVFGATGSGKSTSTIAAVSKAFLRSGFGGTFFSVKPDDCQTYVKWTRETGREHDVMIFGPGRDLRYNPIDAELRRKDRGAGFTENITALLSTLLEVSERSSGSGASEEAGYFKRANRQLMRNSVDLLVISKGRLSVPELYRLVISAPTSLEQVRSDEWRQGSFCYRCLQEADAKAKTPELKAVLETVADFFVLEFASLSSRTRSVIVSTFTSMIDVLNRGVIRDLTSSPESNCTPEMAQDGKIIIIDVPIKLFGEIGIFLQVLWKHCFQAAQERRDVAANPRPVFIVTDECHLLATSNDQLFQTTCRSSRTAVVNATQSISNFHAALGPHCEAAVFSLMGNLQTQVFHQQTDVKTNAYAAELIGRTRQFVVNASNSRQPGDWMAGLMGSPSGQTSSGVSEVFEWEVQPSRFASLRKGGPPSWECEAIVYQGGRRFSATGRPWMPVTFKQHL